MRKWRIEDSEELYNITGWGTSYFGINEKGHVVVTPRKDGVEVDLKELVDELQLRDVTAPMLVRFPDILDNRIEKVSCCFQKAAEEYGYKGENFIIYPIKVNQMRPVVEEMINHGKKFNLGLEAGSKPNCMLSLPSIPTPTRSWCATATRTRASSSWLCWPRRWVSVSSSLLRN